MKLFLTYIKILLCIVDNDYEHLEKVPYYQCSRNCRFDENACDCSYVARGEKFWGYTTKENDKYTDDKSC